MNTNQEKSSDIRSLSEELHAVVKKSLLLTCAIVGLLYLCVGFISHYYEFEYNHKILANLMADNAKPSLVFKDSESVREALASSDNVPTILQVALYEREGNLFFSHEKKSHDNHFFHLLDSEYFHSLPAIRKDIEVPILMHEEKIGSLHLTYTTFPLLEEAIILIGIFILSGALGFLFSTTTLQRLLPTILSPISTLSTTIHDHVQSMNFKPVQQSTKINELLVLINSYNNMVEQLHVRDAKLREYQNNLENLVEKRTAALEIARDEAVRANNAKSEFLSSVSHELRTPMNAIMGFAQLLDMEDTLDMDSRENVKEILTASEHLLALINEILDLSKIESGAMQIDMEAVDAKATIDYCIELVKSLADKRNISLSFNTAGPVSIMADKLRLRQVLINLLSNAIKYNIDGGRVDIALSELPSGRACIAISDTGIGFELSQVNELFETFNRGEAENSVIEGTGIGLGLTRNLLQLMGGDIHVESEPGSGSVFSIEFDCCSSPMQQLHPVDDSTQATHPIREESPMMKYCVLYIEDNPQNTRLVENFLAKDSSINLVCTDDPKDGLRLAREIAPDLILLDINLPGMSGYDVLDKLISDGLGNIPVVAMSANAMRNDLEKGLAAGFCDYLTKPLNLPKFKEVISKYLDTPRKNCA